MDIRQIIRSNRVRACLAALLLASQPALADTTITGTQSVTIDDGLGAGLITLDGGTLSFDGPDITLDNDFLVTESGGALLENFHDFHFLNGDFVLDGDLVVGGLRPLLFAGAISGSGRLIVGNAGMAIFGDAVHTGGTLIQPGSALQIGGGQPAGNIGGAIENHGELNFIRLGDFTNDSVISGPGIVQKLNDGMLTFTGDQTYSGDTFVHRGSLRFKGSTSGLGGNIHLFAHSSVRFNQEQDSSFAGDISGNGSVWKSGAGTLTLTGSSTYTGVTVLSGGTLVVNGSIASRVETIPMTTLSGNGSVGSVNVGIGTIAPGDGIGTLTVNGNLFLFGTYEFEANDPGHSDLIHTTGHASLFNAKLDIVTVGLDMMPGEYTILTADGGLTGEFDDVPDDFAFFDPTLRYDMNNVYLTMAPNGMPLSHVAETPNQRQVAKELDALGFSPGGDMQEVMDELAVMNADEARRAFDQLSGVQYVHSQYVARQTLRGLQRLSFGRLGGSGRNPGLSGLTLAFSDAPWAQQLEGQWLAMLDGADMQMQNRGLWVRGYGVRGDIDADTNAVGADYDTAGLALGLDADFGEHWMAGVAGGLAGADVDSPDAKSDTDTFQISGYAGYRHDRWYAHGFIGHAWHDVESARRTTVGAFSALARADYDMTTFSAALELGHDFDLAENMTLTPFATVDYARTHRESFTESNAVAIGLDVDGETAYSLRPTFGLRFSHSLTADNGWKFEPVLYAAYAREVMDNIARVHATFADVPGDGFVIDGPETDRNRFLAGAALNTALTQRALLSFAWDAELAGSDTAHALSATFRYRW